MFRLQWVRSARARLATIWVDAPLGQREAIAQTVNAIEHQLSLEPLEAGESREPERRILLAPPLGVKFRVQPRLRLGTVFDVWRYGKRG